MDAIASDEDPLPRVIIETTRLALQNYDWSSLSIKELFFLFESYLSDDKKDSDKKTLGVLKRVSIYLSDFGEERLKEEKKNGPKKILEKIREKLRLQGERLDEEDYNSERMRALVETDPLLREYERDRLRYYYAILEFSNVSSADFIYSNCDGMEFEKSGMKIDLRGVPKELVIPKKPTEVCESSAGLDTQTLKKKSIRNLAKSHTHVELSWDVEEKGQMDTGKLFEKEEGELREEDIRAVIASEDENDQQLNGKGYKFIFEIHSQMISGK